MTWSAKFVKPDGTVDEGQYCACQSCKHGQYDFETATGRKINPCSLVQMANNIGSMLTSIDVGADGHMAGGSAVLKCSGFEPMEK